MLYSLPLFPRAFVGSCDQVKQSHRMAIVFLDCQRGSLRLTQMMSLDVKMLEETFHSVESNLWAPQGALLGLVQKTSTPHYIARHLSTLRLHPRPTFGSTGDSQVPQSTYFWAFKSDGNPKSMKCISYLEPSWVHLSPREYQWHWICCKSRLSRIHLSSPWPADEG